MINFSIPKFGCHAKPSGVYKIIFDEKYFYIGSSGSLKQRFWQWKFKITNGENKNRRIRELCKIVKEVRFEVIEFVQKGKNIEAEGRYIKQYWNNPFLLNYCQDPKSCYGIEWDDEDLKARKKTVVRNGGKPVAVFDMYGKLVKQFEYLVDASAYTKISNGAINNCLAGKTPPILKGLSFKLITKNGYQEPPIFVKNKRAFNGRHLSKEARKRMSAAQQKAAIEGRKPIPDHAKPVNIYDKNDSFVISHLSINAVAKWLGVDNKRIKRILSGKRGKTCRGYSFKFA